MHIKLCLFALAISFFTFASCLNAQEIAQVSPELKNTDSNKEIIDLPNFHQVHPYLYRGGEPTHTGLQKLKQMGVVTVIDLRGHPKKIRDEKSKAKQLGLRYINLPMSSKAPTQHQVRTFLKTVEKAALDPTAGAIFVHCAHGSDRTGCMVGIWRVTHDGLTFDEAYKEMRKYYFTPKFTQLSGAVQQYAQGQPKADRKS